MEAADNVEDFVPAGLALLGIEADEVETAVINAAHQMFWPGILGLISMDLDDVAPERDLDLSRAPGA